MNGVRVWLYYNRFRGEERWYADAQVGDVMLHGLRLNIVNEQLKGVLRPSVEQMEALRQILSGSEADSLRHSVLYRLKVFLRRDTDLYLADENGDKRIESNGTAGKEWILFRKAEFSQLSAQNNFRATIILPSGLEICGVYVEWQGKDSVYVRMPSLDSLEKAEALLQQDGTWEEIRSMIIQTYVQRYEQAVASAAPAAVQLQKSKITDGILSASLSGDTVRTEELAVDTPQEDLPAAQLPVGSNEAGEHTQYAVKKTNRYGRIMNSDDSGLLRFTSGNVLRPVEMIEQIKKSRRYKPQKPDVEQYIKAMSNGQINMQDIEILSMISIFRYITSAMLIDLYSSGYIPHDENVENFSQDRINKRINMLTKYGLITPCRFISTDAKGDLDFERVSVGRIHVISQQGGMLLRELGRVATARAFDVYQDARTVRERLCVNQWTVYWLAAYPEIVGVRFGFDHIAYRFDEEMAGARMPAWVLIKDQLLIGQHVRRCDARQQDVYLQEMLSKLKRIGDLFEDIDKLYSFDGEEYKPMQLAKRPIVQYICEDEEHMRQTAALLQPILPEGQEIWMTWDQGLFNYEYEGRRFWRIEGRSEPGWVSPGQVFGIGEERKEEKRLDELDALRSGKADAM